MCVGVIISMFIGTPIMILCIVDSLNLSSLGLWEGVGGGVLVHLWHSCCS